MSDGSHELRLAGEKVLQEMVQNNEKRVRVFLYGDDDSPVGIATVERRPFDPRMGD